MCTGAAGAGMAGGGAACVGAGGRGGRGDAWRAGGGPGGTRAGGAPPGAPAGGTTACGAPAGGAAAVDSGVADPAAGAARLVLQRGQMPSGRAVCFRLHAGHVTQPGIDVLPQVGADDSTTDAHIGARPRHADGRAPSYSGCMRGVHGVVTGPRQRSGPAMTNHSCGISCPTGAQWHGPCFDSAVVAVTVPVLSHHSAASVTRRREAGSRRDQSRPVTPERGRHETETPTRDRRT
jgi:hypothetical protein